MNSRSTSPVGAMTAPAWASRNSRSMLVCFENAAPPQVAHRRRGDADRDVAGRGLGFEHAQHRRVPRPLEVIDEVVDARREPIGVDLHRRELRAQRRQALAEALAQMLEPGVLEMRRGRRDRGAAEAQAPRPPSRD